MDEITPKERILKRIREALIAAPMAPQGMIDLESPVFAPVADTMEVVFAENFVRKGGRFVYCENADIALKSIQALVEENAWNGHVFCRDEAVESLLQLAGIDYGKEAVDAVVCKVGFCACRNLIANDGSLLFDTAQTGRRIFAQAETLVFVASIDQLLPDLRTAWKLWKDQEGRMPSSVSIWTGLSHFTDVDGTAMTGLGPKKIFLVFLDNIDLV
ncbi:MAG: LUD domain-containing protein [Bacteroidales bacterium]|nr:LUD domain-containing protein [Bacteroidales bacterium]MDE7073040.1 LUD domain-containing protein [Bacteroidales bacterium]